MGFDDILRGELDERARRDHERRQMLMALPGRADEARDNAQAAVVTALANITGLSQPGFASTGYPPPITDDAVKRAFAVTARTESGQIEFMVSGVLQCRLEDGRFVYDHDTLRLHVTGFNFMQPRTREATFTGYSCGVDQPSYEIDSAKFEAALQALVKKLAAWHRRNSQWRATDHHPVVDPEVIVSKSRWAGRPANCRSMSTEKVERSVTK